jgi:hypothetical protein
VRPEPLKIEVTVELERDLEDRIREIADEQIQTAFKTFRTSFGQASTKTGRQRLMDVFAPRERS